MNQKTLSFVMPCYNDGDSIEKAVRSIRDQDLEGIEMIVVNDASTDDSRAVIDGLKEQGLIDKVIHLEKNEGACVARNEGAKIAEGKYLSFLPADALLYPGMAKIWYETLEENPDYDFLYGGYRFVDEEGEPIPNGDYFFHPFEPYLLEVTNYIDGSFPIKRESYWKFAKIMNQPNGLWDPSIKSLQDWDFWLSVVKNGGKGIYMQDIFFATTTPHEGGLSSDSSKNWLERTEAIKAKHKIPIRKLCVASLGANFHARRIAYILNVDFKEMPSFKPHRYHAIYVIGFYPEFAAQQDQMLWNNLYKPDEGRTAAKKVVHLIGSDIWQLYNCSLRSLEIWKQYFANNINELLVEAEFTQEEVKKILGLEAKIVPIPPLKLFDVKPMPKDFVVACYQPQMNEQFYRPNEMREIAKKCPDIKFKFFGYATKLGIDTEIKNIEHCGYISDMEGFVSECSAVMRFPVHDGLPINVLEFLLAGRYSIQSVPVKHTAWLPQFDIDTVIRALNEIKQIAQNPNQEAADYWRKELDHDKYRKTILELTGYEPKTYWENRAKAWSEQASKMPIEVDEVKEVFQEAKKLLEKESPSVMDIGCGDGRWYPYLKEWGIEDYYGTDISENLIKAAQMRFPHLKDRFWPAKAEDLGDKRYDIVFSYTTLEHIVEEDWPKAVEALKKTGKLLLLIEPIDFISRFYCHAHDYKKAFPNVIKEVQLKDKVILLCQME